VDIKKYWQYGVIGVIAIVILYAVMRGGQSSAPAASDGAVAVDVNYSPQGDPAAKAAQASAFSEIAGLFSLAISEESELAQARLGNETARAIAAGEEATARYGLDVGRQVAELQVRGARELAEFQAQSVNYLAESFRTKDLKRQSAVLNALTSIWGAPPTYAPQGSTSSQFLGGVSNVISSVGRLFGGGGRL
jgi:hypothetical protein